MARSDIYYFTAHAVRSGIESSLSGETLSVTTQPLLPPLRLDLHFSLFFCFLFFIITACCVFLHLLSGISPNIWLKQTDNSFNRIIRFSPRYSVPESEVTGAQTQHAMLQSAPRVSDNKLWLVALSLAGKLIENSIYIQGWNHSGFLTEFNETALQDGSLANVNDTNIQGKMIWLV